jgi:tetratricopeptide (TPR) repeat protein
MGITNILLGALGLLSSALIIPSTLVISPEFGVAMVAGTPARWGLWALLIGTSVTAGIAWHSLRAALNYPNRLHWLWSIGLLAGIWAASRVWLLDAESSIHVYAYYFYWPPFALWGLVCLIEIGLTVLRFVDALTRVLLGTAAVAGVVLWFLHQPPESVDLRILRFWQEFSWLFFPVSLAWLTGSVYPWLWERKNLPFSQIARWRVLITAGVALAGVITTILWVMRLPEVAPIPRTLAWVSFCLWLVALLSAIISRLLFWYQARSNTSLAIDWKAWLLQFAPVVLIAGIAVGLMDLFLLGNLQPITCLVLLFLCWTVLVEAFAAAPILSLWKHPSLKHIWEAESPARAMGSALAKRMEMAANSIKGMLQRAFSAQSVPTALIKTLFGVALLIFLAELPDAGKAIISPLNDKSLACEKEESGKKCEKEIGRSISEEVANIIGLLGPELQPELLLPQAGGEKKSKTVLNAASGGLEAEVKEELEIGGVKLPLGLLRTPARSLFNIQVISGSVKRQGEAYVASMSSPASMWSTAGETWEARFPDDWKPIFLAEQQEKEDLQSHGDEGKNNRQQDQKCYDQLDPSCVAARLSEELAYKIIVSRPALANAGMTRSWQAFRFFREGLKSWRHYEVTPNEINDLSEAVKKFRIAITFDPSFALAHYRLGQALLADRQPGLAIAAFQDSVRAMPDFVTGYLALASAVNDFDAYREELPAYISLADLRPEKLGDPGPRTIEARAAWELALQKVKISKAKKQWTLALRLSSAQESAVNQGSAYYGLCRIAFPSNRVLAYYYCKFAEHLYNSLPASKKGSDAKVAKAAVLDMVGVILDSPNDMGSRSDRVWQCDPNMIQKVPPAEQWKPKPLQFDLRRGPHVRNALRYYHRALDLTPDDLVIRCNIANAELSIGNKKPMEELENDATAHLQVAEEIRKRAKEETDESVAPDWYYLALKEYEEAIRLAPDIYLDAMNGYAYTFWQWRLNWPELKPPAGPGPVIAHRAEGYARETARLSHGILSPVEEATYLSTLGEVLLAQGRAEEAVEILERIKVEDQPWETEVRWDRAKGYICVSNNDKLAGIDAKKAHTDWWKKAAPLLQEISKYETNREVQPFGGKPGALDPARYLEACQWKPEYQVEREPNPLVYGLKGSKPSYAHHEPCTWSGISSQVLNRKGAPVDGLFVHVWGRGIDRRIPAAQDQDVFLTSQPEDTHFYYFAQLEDREVEGKPLSRIYLLNTFANKSGKCTQNLIRLTFVETPRK